VDQELDIRSLEDYDDQDIIFMSKKIEKIKQTLESLGILKIPIDEMEIVANVKSQIYEKLGSYILNNSQVFSRNVVLNGQQVLTAGDAAIGQNSWICLTCEKICPNERIDCEKCHTFRTLETYPNIIHLPFKVSL
jgi:hypothetical protein